MKVLFIGGTGNISTSIVRLLLQLGHDVTCINRGKGDGLYVNTAGIGVVGPGGPVAPASRARTSGR